MILFLSHSGAIKPIFDAHFGEKALFCRNDHSISTIDSWRPHLDRAQTIIADHPNFSHRQGILAEAKATLVGVSPHLADVFDFQGHELYTMGLPTIPGTGDHLVWALFYNDSWLTKPRDVNGKATREAKKASVLLEPLITNPMLRGYVGPLGLWYTKRWGKRYVARLDPDLAFPAYARFVALRHEVPEITLSKLAIGRLIE